MRLRASVVRQVQYQNQPNMNNTPRTDKQREIIDSIRPDGFHRVEHLLAFAAELETELAAVTKERDRLAEALRNAERTCADD